MSSPVPALLCGCLLAGSLLFSPVVAHGAPHRAEPSPDPVSGGDPYFPLDGNRGYDVEHYRISDTYRPSTDRLRGRTVLTATATEDLPRFSLDLVLGVDSVTVDGRPADFGKPQRHELVVEPARRVQAGDTFTVVVGHHGRPGSVEAAGARPGQDLYFRSEGETVAMGEPQNGAWWFAANETPADKATFDVTIRVPRGTEAISGGALVSQRTGTRWTTWRWRLDEQLPTYAVFFAAGQFRVDRSTERGRPFVHAVSRQLTEDDQRLALRRLRTTDDVVAWFEEVLAPYPFGEGGGVVSAVPSAYALETATRPVYPWSSARSSWVPLLVHETAHQWFGNDVTLRRWRDVWLNEGFATYAEWWYAEEHGGRSTADRLENTWSSIPADSEFWQVRVSDPGPARMWDDAVYVRGAMTLAALRNRLGAATFATVLEQWVTRHAGGHVSGTDFRDLAEEIGGEQLDAFFQHWLDDPGRPAHTAENGLG